MLHVAYMTSYIYIYEYINGKLVKEFGKRIDK